MESTDDTAVPVEIRVIRGNNLQGSSAEPLKSFVQVELDGNVLGVSDTKQVEPGEQQLGYDFTCSFQCSKDAQALDDIAHNPIILTVTEVLPKDKKKGERTMVLGQAVVDLLPLLQGQCSFTPTVSLFPVASSMSESSSQNSSSKLSPTLDISISVVAPLLSEADLSASNMLKVTVDTAYSVPQAWTVPSPYTYSAALQVPLTAEDDQVLLFSDGELKAGGQREAEGRQRKRPHRALLMLGNHFLSGTSFQAESVKLENGELTGLEDQEFRIEAETMKKRVSWDTERRCLLDAGGAARLRQRITESRLWPVEIMRSSSPLAKTTKTNKPLVEEEQHNSFHGLAFLDMGSLLNPGVTRIRGAYTVHPFSEIKLLDKTKQSTSVFSVLNEQARAAADQVKGHSDSPEDLCKSKAGKTVNGGNKAAKDPARKPSGQTRLADIETDTELRARMDVKMYEEARTYIIIEFALEKPLVHKRSPEVLATRVKELVPPRTQLPQHPSRADKAERAVLGFHNQVASVVEQVLEQFVELYATGADPLQPCSPEEMKAEMNGALNISGRYFAFKEQMKYSVVRIVRDKIQRTTPLTDPQELRAFISDLYVYLVDEMHIALNKILSEDLQEPRVQIQLNSSQLRLFAREAQLTGQYQQAAHYCQELVVQEPAEPSHWCQWGSLCMQTGDYLKAEECFHHAVSIQQTHQHSLLMCGILAAMFKRYEEAQTFLERATSIKPTGVVAWMLLGLFHESQNDPFKAMAAFLEANRQLKKEGRSRQRERNAQTDKEKEKDEKEKDKVSSIIYRETVQFLLQNYALQMAECALSHELLCSDGGRSGSFLVCQAQLQLLRADYCSAAATLKEAMFHSVQDADVWALNGHLHYLNGELRQAQESYERCLDFQQQPSDTQLIHLRMGSIYLQENKFEQAKAVYLRACQHWASCVTWLGLGIACYRLEDLGEAEDALTEANHLNKLNAEVWGYLFLICLKCGRRAEAEQTYKYAKRLNLQKESLLLEIKELQDQLGFGDPFIYF
ncbi:cilia- and flagella-associated protein 70-like [Genypterus blacodes]|uniref:cilia- and flagella-associated protein 70-like n=1 Tax=Genypterus blacodes TaxID=154954 RepID=UPI003F7754D6